VDEFALIRRHFAALSPPADSVALGIGDDCALVRPAPGQALAMTTDTLVAGRHFPYPTRPADIGWKSLAVSLSDLAAMGAEPRWFLLALTLPDADDEWLTAFAGGLQQLAQQSGICLVGGDTTRGPLSITITAIGLVPAGAALRRDGAQVGDLVCVTGTLGDAALGLARSEAGSFQTPDDGWLRVRLDRPTPRLRTGIGLRGLAHAAIDLSDGLAGDLGHVLEASGVGAMISVESLPMSEPFVRLAAMPRRLELQAAGGDDYELCLCIPPARLDEARRSSGTSPRSWVCTGWIGTARLSIRSCRATDTSNEQRASDWCLRLRARRAFGAAGTR
jgi:thiamine-monophosphate kinase